MMARNTNRTCRLRVRHYVIILIATWTTVVGGLFYWTISRQRAGTRERAQAEARAHFQRDQVFRRWIASHGGVYVPVDQNTPPNPYLSHLPHRDIIRPDGTLLTLVNPAFTVRQMNEQFSQLNGVPGHLTSLDPLRPENGPDDWERAALEAFQRGETEVNEFTQINGEPHLRLMKPLIVKQSCLKCHADQGCKVGDIRGGMSIALPMGSLLARQREQISGTKATFGTVWVLGLIGILWGGRIVHRRMQHQSEAERALRDREIELRRSETKFRALFDSSSDAVMLLDERGFLDCNDATVKIFGCSDKAEFCSKHPGDLSPAKQPCGADSMTLAKQWIVAAMEKGGNLFEWTHKRLDTGEAFPAEVMLNAMELDGRSVLQAVVRDITERKRVEQQIQDYAAAVESHNLVLEELSQSAQAANRSKSEFLANMSHEIRTPMTAILGFSDVLLGNLDEEENVSAATTIKRNGEYLLELINDILDLSKIEAGKLEIERIACSPVSVVADVASLMRVRAEAKGLPLEIEYVGGIPQTIICDPIRLRQILINLVGNAIKFTEAGSVRLLTRLAQSSTRPPRIQFDVIDEGIGMTQEQASRLFQPFTQADASTTRKFGGTGLGLTITKRLAEMLGGEITISSELGGGSTFSVTVETGPLDGVPMLQNAAEADQRQKGDASILHMVNLDCRILLAEDGPDNRRLISFVLRKAGADVTLAENGLIARDMALAAKEAKEPFDVILMDMQMPVMDGYTATRKLRDADYTGPIIALTANAMAGDEEKCLRAGCNGYASKPIDRRKLFATITRFLGHTASATEASAGGDA